jgi:hypothetical protein
MVTGAAERLPGLEPPEHLGEPVGLGRGVGVEVGVKGFHDGTGEGFILGGDFVGHTPLTRRRDRAFREIDKPFQKPA